MNFIRGLAGCEPEKLSTNVFRMGKGYIFDSSGTTGFEFPNYTDVDLTTQGLNGLDVAGGPQNGDLFIYLISDGLGSFGFLASAEKFAGDVTLPVGFAIQRKLPFGVVYASSRDGIPNYHLAHWPRPFVTLTDAESTSAFCALAAGSDTSWTDVDLTAWMPDNARLAYLSVQTRYLSGTASAYIRSHSGQTTGILVGSVSASSAYQNNTQFIRVTSERKIQYKLNASGGRLYIYVHGYCMTEPA